MLSSTLDIGPWNLQFFFGFSKVNRCQRSIEKHSKSLKLNKIIINIIGDTKDSKSLKLNKIIINIDGDTKDLNNLAYI